jgi:hypothetical protein
MIVFVLRPFADVSYTIKSDEKRAENRVFDRLRHDEIRPQYSRCQNGEIRLKTTVSGRAFSTWGREKGTY